MYGERQRYPIRPHDIVCYDNQLYKVKGCHNKRKNVMLNAKKSVVVNKTIIQHAGGYVPA